MPTEQLSLGKADPLPHTPGPWRVARKAEGHGWTIVGPSGREHDRPMDWFVARTISDEPEDEANARLIGCAPEMLAALRDAVAALGGIRADNVPKSVREVIAKAEGR